jgi:hypothetical protein
LRENVSPFAFPAMTASAGDIVSGKVRTNSDFDREDGRDFDEASGGFATWALGFSGVFDLLEVTFPPALAARVAGPFPCGPRTLRTRLSLMASPCAFAMATTTPGARSSGWLRMKSDFNVGEAWAPGAFGAAGVTTAPVVDRSGVSFSEGPADALAALAASCRTLDTLLSPVS